MIFSLFTVSFFREFYLNEESARCRNSSCSISDKSKAAKVNLFGREFMKGLDFFDINTEMYDVVLKNKFQKDFNFEQE